MDDQKIMWEALEYEHKDKTPDWFWILGLVSLTLIVSAIIYKNILFAALIVVGAFTMALYAVRKPRFINFEINDKGVVIKNTLYPYKHLHSFCPREDNRGRKIIFQSKKSIMPHFSIPVPANVNFERAKTLLLKNIPEDDHPESLSEVIMNSLGF